MGGFPLALCLTRQSLTCAASRAYACAWCRTAPNWSIACTRSSKRAGSNLPQSGVDVLGVSGRAILYARLEPENAIPNVWPRGCEGRVRAKPEQLVEALTGDLRPHHLVLLRELLTRLSALEQSIRKARKRN
jgi:hypothetical protein